MHEVRRFTYTATPEEQEESDRQTSSLAGLAVALALVVVCLFLARELHAKAAVEDCLLAGRLNCDAVVTADGP